MNKRQYTPANVSLPPIGRVVRMAWLNSEFEGAEWLGDVRAELEDIKPEFHHTLLWRYETIEEDISHDCMKLFEQSIGKNVRVKGTPLVDEITGVNWDLMTVKVKNYGEFGVHLCELTNEEIQSQTN